MTLSDPLVENFERLRPLLDAESPAEFSALRDRAIQDFAEYGLPTIRDEEFKYVSLRVLQEGGFGPAYGATVDRHEVGLAPLGSVDAVTLSFINGEYAPEISSDHLLPEGAFFGTLADAMLAHREDVLRHLSKVAVLRGKLGTTNDERFVKLNTAYLTHGAFLFIPRGVSLPTVHVRYVSRADHGPFASHPRLLVVLEDGAAGKVIESYVGLDGVYFSNAVTEVVLGRNAVLEHNRVVAETGDSVHIGNLAIHQEEASVYTSNSFVLSGKIARNDVNVWHAGPHIETWLNGAFVITNGQVVDNHTRIDHAFPDCHSFEVYKHVIRDQSTGIFNGKIFVYEDAQRTDAKQTNQALLLSPNATMNTKPQLEIFADDVKCTHGATIGQLREDAMFYLQARGIPKAEAQALLVYAFAGEVINKVTIPDLRAALESAVYEKLK